MAYITTRVQILYTKGDNRKHIRSWWLYCREFKEHGVENCLKKQCKLYYAKSIVLEYVLKNETAQSQ